MNCLQRLADAQVQLGPTGAADPVVERTANEFVREAVDEAARRDLFDHSAALGWLEGRECREVGGVHGRPGGA